VVVEGQMKGSREKKTAQGRKSLDVMKVTSIACAAVPREGHAANC